MKNIDYQKILKKLLKEYPHDLDKIEKVISDAKKNREFYDYNVYIDLDEIIKSKIWDADEKYRLLKFFGYNKQELSIGYIDEYKNSKKMDAELYTIKHDIFSGFVALMKRFEDIERYDCGSKDEAYRNVFDAVSNNCKDENKTVYLKAILENLTVDDIKRLIAPCYEGHYIAAVHYKSIFINILDSKDLDLVKEYIGYVDDINMYLSEAVATGDIEIVKFLLEQGADINYLPDEVILGRLTPLKTAIVKNDYNMAKFLIDNGADINLQGNCDDFINRLNNYQIEFNDRWIEPVTEENDSARQLRYIRESSPLEFAIKLKDEVYKSEYCYNHFIIEFNGQSFYVRNQLEVYMDDLSEKVRDRGRIVDFIFDKLEDKTNINYTDLVGFTFITRDLKRFKKYTKEVLTNNIQLDFDYLFRLYFQVHLVEDKEMSVAFMDVIKQYAKDSDVYFLKFFNYYLNNVVKWRFGANFYINDVNKELLNRISENERKNICLVPYCKNLKSVKELLSLGFDINQVDDEGRNILYHLLCYGFDIRDFNAPEAKLFNYLLKHVDLSTKDKYNKTVLYYAMQKFRTKDEHLNARKNRVGVRDMRERAITILISKMNAEDISNDDINKILEKRNDYGEDYGEKMHFEYVYQHHKDLFDALIDKEFVLSDKVLSNIFESLYPQDERLREIRADDVDMDATLEFIFTRLDSNTEVQKLDIEQEFKDLMLAINSKDISFEEFVKYITTFNDKIISLNQFYENNIKKRFSPERYLVFAKEKYHTVYENLNSYLLVLIIKGIKLFGVERLEDILSLLPNYDINEFVVNKDVGLSYYEYGKNIYEIIDTDEDGEPKYNDEYFEPDYVFLLNNGNVSFTGDLMQYAILTDNLPMVQLLQKRGASIKFSINEVDRTWNYVNSCTMLNYMESVVGKKNYSGFDDDETNYYLGLFN